MVPRRRAGYGSRAHPFGGQEDDVSMWTPMEPNLGRGDDGIPAADPGPEAPPPADGFGIGGEEPARPEETDPAEETAEDH